MTTSQSSSSPIALFAYTKPLLLYQLASGVVHKQTVGLLAIPDSDKHFYVLCGILELLTNNAIALLDMLQVCPVFLVSVQFSRCCVQRQ